MRIIINSDNRVLGWYSFGGNDGIQVDSLPPDNYENYLYVDGQYIYDPLPVRQQPPIVSLDQRLQKLQKSASTIEKIMDLISIDRYQSDKIGFDFEVIKLGDIQVRKTYVQQDEPFGTSDNPIVWKDGMTPINNAFYLRPDGNGEYVRYVWMGQWVQF